MKFKAATIDIRFSRLAGVNARGIPEPGLTFMPRYIQNIIPGQRVELSPNSVEYWWLEIRPWDNEGVVIDGEIFNSHGRFVYAFPVDGIAKAEYTNVKFNYDGVWYILEYRFLSRENS